MADTPIIVKKKKAHGHAHHGGSWKVAYADFVTAMWAFFMVMWIMGLSDDIRQKIQGYFNDPLGFMKNQPKAQDVISLRPFPNSKPGTGHEGAATKIVQSEKKDSEAKQLTEKIKTEISKATQAADLKDLLKHVEITVTPEGIRIELLESTGAVFFESGRAVIKPDAMPLINSIAKVLAGTNRQMIVEGHTDAKPYAGKDYTNWDLSTDRARAMMHALMNGGVRDSQMLGVRGLAATQLRKPEAPFDYSNRRVSILLPFATDSSSKIEMPKEEAKEHVDAMFRSPIAVAPQPPNINGDRASK